MTELILLGAGASVEAGIPDSFSMTKRMVESFSERNDRSVSKLLNFVVGGLLFQKGVKGKNPYAGINIEDLFNAVQLLGDRQNSELSPFVSAWHPQLISVESRDISNYFSRKLLDEIYKPIIETITNLTRNYEEQARSRKKIEIRPAFYHNFEQYFSDGVRQITMGANVGLFETTTKRMVKKLVEMVWVKDSSKVAYLIPLIKNAVEEKITLVTLNYDNTIELAGTTEGITIDNGFQSWSDYGEFSFDSKSVPLIKLHGSINWALTDGKWNKDKPLPYQIIEQIDLNKNFENNFMPAVVFGGKNKLTARGPFLRLLRTFEEKLAGVEILTVIGYSFRDEHVNEFIADWFNGAINRKIRIINPDKTIPKADFSKNLFMNPENGRVQFIDKNAGVAIAEIYGGI